MQNICFCMCLREGEKSQSLQKGEFSTLILEEEPEKLSKRSLMSILQWKTRVLGFTAKNI